MDRVAHGWVRDPRSRIHRFILFILNTHLESPVCRVSVP